MEQPQRIPGGKWAWNTQLEKFLQIVSWGDDHVVVLHPNGGEVKVALSQIDTTVIHEEDLALFPEKVPCAGLSNAEISARDCLIERGLPQCQQCQALTRGFSLGKPKQKSGPWGKRKEEVKATVGASGVSDQPTGKVCQKCNRRPIQYSSRGLCYACYEAARRVEKKEKQQTGAVGSAADSGGLCKKCGKRPANKKGYCQRCYGTEWRRADRRRKNEGKESQEAVPSVTIAVGKSAATAALLEELEKILPLYKGSPIGNFLERVAENLRSHQKIQDFLAQIPRE